MKKSFTLIELLIVVAIIAILAGIVTITVTSNLAKSRDARRKADIKILANALECYFSKNNTFLLTYREGGITVLAGSNGDGSLNVKYSGERKSMSDVLMDSGCLDNQLVDPSSDSSGQDYVIRHLYNSHENAHKGLCLYAKLEAPSELDKQRTTKLQSIFSPDWSSPFCPIQGSGWYVIKVVGRAEIEI